MRAIAKNRVHQLDFDVTNQDIDLKEDISGTLTLVENISFASRFEAVTLGYKTGTTGIDGTAIGSATLKSIDAIAELNEGVAPSGLNLSAEAEETPRRLLRLSMVFC